jgi:hypothetical protein
MYTLFGDSFEFMSIGMMNMEIIVCGITDNVLEMESSFGFK